MKTERNLAIVFLIAGLALLFPVFADAQVTLTQPPGTYVDNSLPRRNGTGAVMQASAITVGDVASSNVSLLPTTGLSLTVGTLDSNANLILAPHGTGTVSTTSPLLFTSDPTLRTYQGTTGLQTRGISLQNSGTPPAINMFAVGTNGQMTYEQAGGTYGALTATTAGTPLAIQRWRAYNGTNFSNSNAEIGVTATGNQTLSNAGGEIRFQVTPVNTTSLATGYAIQSNIAGTTGWNRFFSPNRTRDAWGTTGSGFQFSASTTTDGSSSGTVPSAVSTAWSEPTFAASSATTYTDAANLYIAGPVTASTNVTITNNHAIWVDSGNVRVDGNINSIGGEIQSNSGRVNYNLSAYGAGTAYALTNTAAAIDFGTTDPVLTLNVAGTYLIYGQVNLAYNGATVAAETASIKVRRTNNTAADLSVVPVLDLPVATTLSHTYGIFQIPPFVYTTAATDDSVTLFANVSATLGAGTIDATAIGTSLVAVRLY